MATRVWVCAKAHRLEVHNGDPKRNDKGPPCRKDGCGLPTKGTWMASYKGKKKRFPTKDEAEEWEDKQLKADTGPKVVSGVEPDVTWPEAVEMFTAYLDSRTSGAKRPRSTDAVDEQEHRHVRKRLVRSRKFLAMNSRRKYLADLKIVVPAFEDYTLQEMTPALVDDFIDDSLTEGYAVGTMNGCLMTMQMVFKELCLQLDVGVYPRLHAVRELMYSVEKVPGEHRNEIFLEMEECGMILKHCRTPQLRHFVFGVLNTGLRHRDMLKLKLSEIDFKTNMITTMVKGRKIVHIPLSPEYKQYLLDNWLPHREQFLRNWASPHRNVHPISPYLIPSRVKPSQCYKVGSNLGFRRARLAAAKEAEAMGNHELAEKFKVITPHMLRHTFATHWIYNNIAERGADGVVHMLSDILGHSSEAITKRYAHILKGYANEAMSQYSGKMFNGMDLDSL